MQRRGSTGAMKKSRKSKSKSSKKKSGDVPMIVGSGCGDNDDVVSAEAGEEKPPSLMNSTLSDNASPTEPSESAVLSQGLQALGQFYE
mmetsp:Transcript_5403/g.12751  ORF Transcript_5403/g.12751 Transcript_5403/m.12751 type:complete len:88 (+) Transcript_5403:39-302(+)